MRRNTEDPQQRYQPWHQLLTEPLLQVSERDGIQFPIFLYNISPFSLAFIAQMDKNLDEYRTKLKQEPLWNEQQSVKF